MSFGGNLPSMDDDSVLLEEDVGASIEVHLDDDNDGSREIAVDDVAGEEVVIGNFHEKRKRQYTAMTLRTNDYLRARPRLYVPVGRTAAPKLDEEEEEDPPRLADPDGSYATPSMKKLFKMYSDVSLRKAENFFQAGPSTSRAAVNSRVEVVEEEAGNGEMSAQVVEGEELVDLIDESQIVQEEVIEHDPNLKEGDIVYEGYPDGTVEYELNEMDWPLYSEQPIDFPEACDILLGNIRLPEEKLCKTTPHEYKGIGTFIVDWSSFLNRHDIVLDGLGSWGKPSGRTRFYQLDVETNKYVCVSDAKGQVAKGQAYDVKCQLRKYEHPTTSAVNNGQNRFIKKIISCTAKDHQTSRVAIITYEWIGTPFDFSFLPQMRPARAPVPPPPEGARTWEAASFQASGFGSFPSTCTAMMGDCPLYSMGAIQFHDVCNIIMGATAMDNSKICDRVPQRFRECGTFVIDVDRLASENELRRDDNGQWGKPAGNSRYYKIENMLATRLDKSGKLEPGTHYSLQILCKRYEHPMTGNRFVRKIYTGRAPLNKDYHQTSPLAVITYFWKGEPIPFEIVPQRKVRIHNASDYEMLKREGMFYEDDLTEEQHQRYLEMEGGGGEGEEEGGGGGGRVDGEEAAERRNAEEMQYAEGEAEAEYLDNEAAAEAAIAAAAERARVMAKMAAAGVRLIEEGGRMVDEGEEGRDEVERREMMRKMKKEDDDSLPILQQVQQQQRQEEEDEDAARVEEEEERRVMEEEERQREGRAMRRDEEEEEDDGERQWAKLAVLNQQRFSMLLDRFESVAEKMERMTEMQMNMMWRGRQQQQQQQHHHHQYAPEEQRVADDERGGGGVGQYAEEEVYEEMDER